MARSSGRYLGWAALIFAVVFGGRMLYRTYTSAEQLQNEARTATAPIPAPALAPDSDTLCHSVKLSLAQRNQALEEGYAIDRSRGCITRESFAAIEEAKEQYESQQRRAAAAQRIQEELAQAVEAQVASSQIALQDLAQARGTQTTHVARALFPAREAVSPSPLPQPPADLFVPMTYTSGDMALPAFVSPNPGGGQRYPLMVWLTGGDTNSLGDFWTEGTANNDQSASAFRKAGMVMLFPTLRGGNTNPGQREYFWGEVEDVVAAVLQAARLPYVDPSRIYVGGHSTGGTLALLVAEVGLPVQGIFAFGPVAQIDHYPAEIFSVQWSRLPEYERRLRSPVHWLHAVKTPTWIIEGNSAPGNHSALEQLCSARKSQAVQCVSVQGANHFSVLRPVTQRIASQLLVQGQVALPAELSLD